jgi:hypothetical protein
MKIFVKISLFLLFFNLVFSQNLYICQTHSEEGSPIGNSKYWKISESGGYVTILLTNGKPLPKGTYYIMIDKKKGRDYVEFDNKTHRLNETKNFIAINYPFKESGEFDIYINGPNSFSSESQKITISFENESNKNKIADYSSSSVNFYEQVNNNKPVNFISSANLNKNSGAVFVYIKNSTPLNTNMIIVDVYKKNGNDFNKVYDTKKYAVKSAWDFTFFKYTFKVQGEYKFMIHNEKNIVINSKTIIVTN